MVEGWADELSVVIFLDAPDAVLWDRINERPQGHRAKGDEAKAGRRFIARYRRSFEERPPTGRGARWTSGLPVRYELDDGGAARREGRSRVEGPTWPITPPDAKMRVLHLIIILGETNGQYNEHCLPLMHERDISIVTYFVPKLTPPPEITLFAGDGTLRGFFRALKNALERDSEYDVVHAHAPQTGTLLVLAALAWRRFSKLRPSLVYTAQDSFHNYKPRNRVMMVLSLATFTRVVFCSRSAYESLPRALKRLVRGRSRVVQNGADLDRVDRAVAGSLRRTQRTGVHRALRGTSRTREGPAGRAGSLPAQPG